MANLTATKRRIGPSMTPVPSVTLSHLIISARFSAAAVKLMSDGRLGVGRSRVVYGERGTMKHTPIELATFSTAVYRHMRSIGLHIPAAAIATDYIAFD